MPYPDDDSRSQGSSLTPDHTANPSNQKVSVSSHNTDKALCDPNTPFLTLLMTYLLHCYHSLFGIALAIKTPGA
ncbi:hypothetical protein NEOLEDRAFT_1141179 [Neolentinus lepideus HHB14362 ss-1]|uniref:Uncharacterized protein n=1 Tax=Neolentinus lepideus HHB14362 ss-1 TaxID=1314782 RepID=A0A165NTS5_9AGAM|nr:hypothetical protein NEOLEDRAFT_1141179 [Neolentinus lepideus HHB14362 ss-1]